MARVTDDIPKVDLTPALRIWAKRKNIRPIDFSKRMDWGYSHSWAVLKGEGTFSPEAYGRFFHSYGLVELIEVLKIAKVDLKGITVEAPETIAE